MKKINYFFRNSLCFFGGMPLKKISRLAAGAFYGFMAAFLSGCFVAVIMLQEYIRKMLK